MTVVAGTVGVLTTDVGLVVQSWDAWIAAATGLPEEDARGRPLGELYPDLATRGLLDRVRRVVTSGEVAILASAFHGYLLPCPPRSRTTHFTRMQQHVIVAPLRSDDAIVGIVVTIEDVTARRDREQELARQLESTDESVRLQAVRALAEADSAQRLVAALGDPQAGALGELAHARASLRPLGERAIAPLPRLPARHHPRDGLVEEGQQRALVVGRAGADVVLEHVRASYCCAAAAIARARSAAATATRRGPPRRPATTRAISAQAAPATANASSTPAR